MGVRYLARDNRDRPPRRAAAVVGPPQAAHLYDCSASNFRVTFVFPSRLRAQCPLTAPVLLLRHTASRPL